MFLRAPQPLLHTPALFMWMLITLTRIVIAFFCLAITWFSSVQVMFLTVKMKNCLCTACHQVYKCVACGLTDFRARYVYDRYLQDAHDCAHLSAYFCCTFVSVAVVIIAICFTLFLVHLREERLYAFHAYVFVCLEALNCAVDACNKLS